MEKKRPSLIKVTFSLERDGEQHKGLIITRQTAGERLRRIMISEHRPHIMFESFERLKRNINQVFERIIEKSSSCNRSTHLVVDGGTALPSSAPASLARSSSQEGSFNLL